MQIQAVEGKLQTNIAKIEFIEVREKTVCEEFQ